MTKSKRSTDKRPGLFDDVPVFLAEALDLRHSYGSVSACRSLKASEAQYAQVIIDLLDVIRPRFEAALRSRTISNENWRFERNEDFDEENNRSTEVVLERCLARARISGWANQVPVSSGLVPGRRAIDLVFKHKEKGTYDFVELKTRASKSPVYAAIEIIQYGLVWLLSRPYRGQEGFPSTEVLNADHVRLCVLAPETFYAEEFALGPLEAGFNLGLERIGADHGVRLGFCFQVLDLECNDAAVIRRYGASKLESAFSTGKRRSKYR